MFLVSVYPCHLTRANSLQSTRNPENQRCSLRIHVSHTTGRFFAGVLTVRCARVHHGKHIYPATGDAPTRYNGHTPSPNVAFPYCREG